MLLYTLTNHNIYTPKSACNEYEIALHDHDTPMQDDFNPFIYNNP
jgi:hypothetical protein